MKLYSYYAAEKMRLAQVFDFFLLFSTMQTQSCNSVKSNQHRDITKHNILIPYHEDF